MTVSPTGNVNCIPVSFFIRSFIILLGLASLARYSLISTSPSLDESAISTIPSVSLFLFFNLVLSSLTFSIIPLDVTLYGKAVI